MYDNTILNSNSPIKEWKSGDVTKIDGTSWVYFCITTLWPYYYSTTLTSPYNKILYSYPLHCGITANSPHAFSIFPALFTLNTSASSYLFTTSFPLSIPRHLLSILLCSSRIHLCSPLSYVTNHIHPEFVMFSFLFLLFSYSTSFPCGFLYYQSNSSWVHIV